MELLFPQKIVRRSFPIEKRAPHFLQVSVSAQYRSF